VDSLTRDTLLTDGELETVEVAMMTGFETTTLLVIGLAIGAGAFFIATAMDGLMGPDGFGTIPNMIILIAGGFFGHYVLGNINMPHNDATIQAIFGVTGGFTCLAFLAMLKAVASRYGY
jgi:hypothetical protein